MLVCGTNSYKPMCRTYTSLPLTKPTRAPSKVTRSAPAEMDEMHFFRMQHEFSGLGICPHDPRHNSTAIFAGKISVYILCQFNPLALLFSAASINQPYPIGFFTVMS